MTASIQRLEESIGAKLLHRGRRGAQLSAAGKAFLPHARAVLVALEDGRRAATDVLELGRGEVRIGAGATVSTYLLPPALRAFRADFPNIRFLLRETTTTGALEALRAGQIDLAILSDTEGDLWRRDKLILVAATGVDPTQCPYLTFHQGATTRKLFDQNFPGAHIAMELWSIAAIKGYVQAGMGIALISQAAAVTELAEGSLQRVPHPCTPITRELRIVHRGAELLPPAAAELRRRLLRTSRKRGLDGEGNGAGRA